MSKKATFSIWRGDKNGGKLVDMTTEVSDGMVVLDAVHQIQSEQCNNLPFVGIAKPANVVLAQQKLMACQSSCA